MANVYVEACPKGNREGTPITNFVVEDHAGSALGAFKTSERPLIGPRAKAIRRSSREFGT